MVRWLKAIVGIVCVAFGVCGPSRGSMCCRVPSCQDRPCGSTLTLADDVVATRRVIDAQDGPVVLVGHSYGGAVITNAAVGVPNVKALVYIAAFAPDKGESLAQLVTMNPESQIGPATVDFRPYPLADGGTGIDLYIKKSAFHDAFAGDLPLEVTAQMQATQRP